MRKSTFYVYPRFVVVLFALIFRRGNFPVKINQKSYNSIFTALTAVTRRTLSYDADVFFTVYVRKFVGERVERYIRPHILLRIILHICHSQKKSVFG